MDPDLKMRKNKRQGELNRFNEQNFLPNLKSFHLFVKKKKQLISKANN